MSKIEGLGSKARDSADWNHAWSVVSQLAAARGTALRELGKDDRGASISPTTVPKPGYSTAGSGPAAVAAPPFARITPDQLARDIAEIEQAATALRRAEPALEPRAPDPQPSHEPLTPRSIWLLVGHHMAHCTRGGVGRDRGDHAPLRLACRF
jgi:hypothetical protein